MGKRANPTPEERAAIVAAYRETRSLKKTEDAMAAQGIRWREDVIVRVLDEEGVPRRHPKGPAARPPDAEVRRILAVPWQSGATHEEMSRMIGMGARMSGRDLRRIMAGIPRRPPSWYARREPPALPDDEDGWRWFAGVFDAKATATRRGDGSPSLMVSTGTDRVLVDAIRRATGAGGEHVKRHKGRTHYAWRIDAEVEVREVVRRVLPFLRAKEGVARRLLAELGEDEPVTRAPP